MLVCEQRCVSSHRASAKCLHVPGDGVFADDQGGGDLRFVWPWQSAAGERLQLTAARGRRALDHRRAGRRARRTRSAPAPRLAKPSRAASNSIAAASESPAERHANPRRNRPLAASYGTDKSRQNRHARRRSRKACSESPDARCTCPSAVHANARAKGASRSAAIDVARRRLTALDRRHRQRDGSRSWQPTAGPATRPVALRPPRGVWRPTPRPSCPGPGGAAPAPAEGRGRRQRPPGSRHRRRCARRGGDATHPSRYAASPTSGVPSR